VCLKDVPMSIFIYNFFGVSTVAAAVLTASQCFSSQSRIPKVMFGCASSSHMIKILRAFHGVRGASPGDADDVMRSRQCDDVTGDPLCSYCPGDCVDDSINEVSAPSTPATCRN